MNDICLAARLETTGNELGSGEAEEFNLTTVDLHSVDSTAGVFVFKTHRPDTVVVFTRESRSLANVIDYDAL